MADNYSKILWEAYNEFLLPLGNKKIPCPYRRNEVGSFQELGPEFQGKSSPETLTKTTKKLAKKQNFDLEKATAEEIRNFMVKNKLGIDCSGYIYRMLNYLIQEVRGKNLEGFGLPHVGRTNIAKLTSDEFGAPVYDLTDSKPGDIIRLNSKGDILHGVLIIENDDNVITYAHSSGITNPSGVHTGQIINGKFPDELKLFSYNIDEGDGIRRLKALI